MVPIFLSLAAALGPVAWLARLAIPTSAETQRGAAGAREARAPPSFGDSRCFNHAPTFEEASRRPPLPLVQP